MIKSKTTWKSGPLLLGLAAAGSLQAAIYSWSDDFESYDTGLDNLEDQTAGSGVVWWTDPQATTAIAVVDNSSYGAPAGFGGKSLVIGVTAPVGETMPGFAWATPFNSPHDPALTAPEVETQFVMDFRLASGSASPNAGLQDSFRLTFFDSEETGAGEGLLATLLFEPHPTETGAFAVIRSNLSEEEENTFDTLALGILGADITLEVRMNRLLNKWSASLTEIGGGTVNLFADVNMSGAGVTSQPDFGGIYVDWIKADGASDWGSNFMLIDNVGIQSLESIPEPGVPLLAGVAVLGLLRRRRAS